jgi:RimJ/RimL family protein N-acetyltransferase
MTLRNAGHDDIPFIVELEQKFSAQGFVGLDDLPTHEHGLADPDCLYWIVDEQGAAGGHVILRGLKSVHRCIELKRIVIAEPGRGLGRIVLEAVVDKAFHELKAHRLWLDVFDDNARARHVYRKVGFVEEGVLRECVNQGGRFRSLVVMSILEDEYRAHVRKIQ